MNVFQKIWTEIKFQWQVDCVYITTNKEQRHNLSELKSQVITASDKLAQAKRQKKLAEKQKTRQCFTNTDCLDCTSKGCDNCSISNQRLESTSCPYRDRCSGAINACLVPNMQEDAKNAVKKAQKEYDAAVKKYVDYKQNKR